MMTSCFFALCLMITWVRDAIGGPHCEYTPCSKSCFTSNTDRWCKSGQFRYCDATRQTDNTRYCGRAPTSYHVTVTGAIGYYSTWVESGPNDVQMENNKPIYVRNGHGFYIWWTDDNTWRLNTKVGDSESISECDESNLFNCPWFDLCVIGNGLLSGYYSPQEGKEYMYYRSEGDSDYEFKIYKYNSGSIGKWRLFTYKLGKEIALARACQEDIIFDCWWATDDLDICAA
eukprot:866194_1